MWSRKSAFDATSVAVAIFGQDFLVLPFLLVLKKLSTKTGFMNIFYTKIGVFALYRV